ncbi:MAG: GvpL/GvpF family gas vesicle protein [Mariniphaga sp.]
MTTKGIYIYGIIPNFYSADMFRSLENAGVYAIPFQNISAIVSDRESTILDYTDRETLGHLLINHQKTIEVMVTSGFTMIIPMRLGTIVNSKEEVFTILAKGHDLMMDVLKKMQFLTELDIVVTWADFPATLNELADDPEIIAIKEEIFKTAATPSQVDQVKLGMAVQTKLKEKNLKVELKILESLSAFSIDIKTHEVMNDQMITNSAFLINRSKKENFERVIDQLDEAFNGLLNFKLVGPLPCYSFYTIEMKELNPDHIAEAKLELGLSEETTEAEIKKIYLNKARLCHPDNIEGKGNEEKFQKISTAYRTILDYSVAARQSSKNDLISLKGDSVSKNLFLVKIKE